MLQVRILLKAMECNPTPLGAFPMDYGPWQGSVILA